MLAEISHCKVYIHSCVHCISSSALASPEFEHRQGEELGQHLAHRLAEAFRNDVSIDLPSLSVIPGQQCWILYVDALVLEWSGGMVDVLSLGVRAALQNTLVPKLTVSGEGEEMEFEISDNPHDSTPVNTSNAPIIITLTQVKISLFIYCGIYAYDFKIFACIDVWLMYYRLL